MQNAPMEHSAVLLNCIELPHGFNAFVLSIFEWPLKTGFTVLAVSVQAFKFSLKLLFGTEVYIFACLFL